MLLLIVSTFFFLPTLLAKSTHQEMEFTETREVFTISHLISRMKSLIHEEWVKITVAQAKPYFENEGKKDESDFGVLIMKATTAYINMGEYFSTDDV